MKRPEPDSPDAQRRATAAAEWLVRRDRGLSAAEQDAFFDWLAADPRHAEWLALHRSTVGEFNALATWRPEHSQAPNPDLLAPRRRRVYWLAPAVIAAAASIVLGLGWWTRASRAPVVVTAGEPELRRRFLEDGSVVDLNRGSIVTTTFTGAERRAAIMKGEAYFTVASDPARPFVVSAQGVIVRAIGTAFSVRLDTTVIEVLVTEGRVGVDHGGSRLEVDAGHRALVPLDAKLAPSVTAVTPGAAAQQLNWQSQLLDFSSAPLAIAIAEFNRRNRVQFVLADEALGALPIVASIRSDNVAGFAKFLAAAPGVEVEQRSDTEIVIRRKQ